MSNPFELCPPPALQAEKALLGCLMGGAASMDPMTEPHALQAALAACKATRATLQGPADFFDPANAAIYSAIMHLADKGTPPAPVSVKAELERLGTWAQVNGGEGGDYFLQIVETVPTATAHAHHADLVRRAARTRNEALRLSREMAALNAGEWEPEEEPPPPPAREWTPFPVEVLPEPVRSFVAEVAASVDTDPAFVMAGLLPALAAAVGGSRVLQVKPGWDAPAIVWAAVVAHSGTKKSPALDPCWEPVKREQSRAMDAYALAFEAWEAKHKVYQREMRKFTTAKHQDGEPPVEPKKPTAERLWTADATVEAVGAILTDNPRGILMARDELAGWLGGFDKYSGGKGNESAKWLEFFEGRSVVIDRKNPAAPLMFVPRAAVSVSGGIQPGILRKYLTAEHQDSGLAARLLFAMPPRRSRVWSEAEVSNFATASLRAVFGYLFDLQMAPDDQGKPAPVRIGMSAEAKQAFTDFYNRNGAKIDAAVDQNAENLAAAFSKLEGYAPRLALVLHLAKWAGNTVRTFKDEVDLQSMEAGIALAEWYAGEAERLYAMLGQDAATAAQDRLVAFIRRKGGMATARDVGKNGPAEFQRGDADPEKALGKLARRGLGEWQDRQNPNGGRPSRVFVLKSAPGVAG